ncbi:MULTISPECIES: hypothetical protein [unclassified Variovorax]|uniref:hypothetical protein n=1 Tax=unclassified Variovorax TaxID=663243 RepID=UPI001BD27FA9|nr:MULTISPECIES: hypothetical protein [unclassified Variovorax]
MSRPDHAEAELSFRDAIRARVEEDVHLPEVLAVLEDGFVRGEREAVSELNAAGQGLNFRLGTWVIRNEDLPIVEAIGAVGAVVGAAVGAGISAPVVVAALGAFAAMTWKTWRKGSSLTPEQVKVLGLLEVAGPQSIPDLQARAKDLALDEGEVELLLNNLTQVEQVNGSLHPLVAKQPDGRWKSRRI